MLELVNVPAHARKTGYMADDSATYKKGSFVVQSGVFSAADIASLGSANSNKPGYAKAGDPKLVRAWAGSGGRAFPIDKQYLEMEDADSSHDTVAKGEAVTFYTEGVFRTSEFTDVTTTTVFGDFLKCTASGTLTDEAALQTETGDSVARVVALFDDHTDASKHRLEFELINGEA